MTGVLGCVGGGGPQVAHQHQETLGKQQPEMVRLLQGMYSETEEMGEKHHSWIWNSISPKSFQAA